MNLFDDLMTPSERGQKPATFAAFGIGHEVIGGAAAGLLGPWGGILFAFFYLTVKEGFDLRRGGEFWDGLADALFVAIGVVSIIVMPSELAHLLWILIAGLAAWVRGAIPDGL